MAKIIELPAMARAAQIRAASFDEADNTIEVVWTTGASVRRYDYRGGEYYDEVLAVSPDAIRLERLNLGAPLLDTHSSYELRNVLGSVVPGTARVEGGKGLARIALSRAPDDASVISKIRDGIIRNISVGYHIHRVEKKMGAEGDVGTWRVVDWEPHELSAVPIPADPGAQIRSADNPNDGKTPLYRCEVIGGDDNSALAAMARMKMRIIQTGLRSR